MQSERSEQELEFKSPCVASPPPDSSTRFICERIPLSLPSGASLSRRRHSGRCRRDSSPKNSWTVSSTPLRSPTSLQTGRSVIREAIALVSLAQAAVWGQRWCCLCICATCIRINCTCRFVATPRLHPSSRTQLSTNMPPKHTRAAPSPQGQLRRWMRPARRSSTWRRRWRQEVRVATSAHACPVTMAVAGSCCCQNARSLMAIAQVPIALEGKSDGRPPLLCCLHLDSRRRQPLNQQPPLHLLLVRPALHRLSRLHLWMSRALGWRRRHLPQQQCLDGGRAPPRRRPSQRHLHPWCRRYLQDARRLICSTVPPCFCRPMASPLLSLHDRALQHPSPLPSAHRPTQPAVGIARKSR